MASGYRSRVRVGAQGRVVLPAAIRERLGLLEGDELVARTEGERIVLERREALLEELREELREATGERSLVDELIAERRREAEGG